MKATVIRALLAAVISDGVVVVVGVLMWRWFAHTRGAEAELFCVLAIASTGLVIALARRHGALVLLPPVLLFAWLCGIAASPLVLSGLAMQRTVHLARVCRLWRAGRPVHVACP